MRPAFLIPLAAALCALAVLFSWKSRGEVDAISLPAMEQESERAPRELAPGPAQGSDREQFADTELADPQAAAAERVESEASSTINYGQPEDPIEPGECTLELFLEDAQTGAALAGTIELWRLNAPANYNWSQGDQLQAKHAISKEGTSILNLPGAEYRVIFLGAASGAEHAGAFYVGGSRTEQTLRVHPPREVDVAIELYEIDGTRIESIEVRRGSRSSIQIEPPTPAWLIERTTQREYVELGRGGGGSWSGSSHRPWKQLTASSNGFSLGALLQSSRTKKVSHKFRVRLPDRGEIDLSIDQLPRAGERLVGLFMDKRDVKRHIVTTGGRDVTSALELESHVESHPIVIDEQGAQRSWRDAVIELTVNRPSAVAWKREWTPSQGPMPDYWIEQANE